MSGGSLEETADSTRSRSFLVLSMIVLLYNLAATVRQDFFWPARTPESPGAEAPTTAVTSAKPIPDARNAGKGPLNLRQKFLSGYRVDINRAAMRELSDLPGISDKVATAVVAERMRIGRFRQPSDLLEVRGIKEKRLQKILPFLAGFDNN